MDGVEILWDADNDELMWICLNEETSKQAATSKKPLPNVDTE